MTRLMRGVAWLVLCVVGLAQPRAFRGFDVPDAWKKQFSDPPAVPVDFSGLFNGQGVLAITLNGVISLGTNYASICGEGEVETTQRKAWLTPYKEYVLTASTQPEAVAYDIQVQFSIDRSRLSMTEEGRDHNQARRYRVYFSERRGQMKKRVAYNDYPQWNAEPGDCRAMSTSWIVEVRPDYGMAPVGVAGPKRLGPDSQGDDIWTPDEELVNGASAPGDSPPACLGPGKTSNPANTDFRWEVLLGRLWDGKSAGKLRLLENAISWNTFKPGALQYSSRSICSNEVEVLMTTSDELKQIKVPQAFVQIETPTTNSVELRFYPTSVMQAKGTNRFYPYNTNATPLVVWKLDSADGTTNSLRIREFRADRTNSTLLSYSTSGGNVWNLTRGSGSDLAIQKRTVQVTTNGLVTRLETVENLDYANTVVDKSTEVHTGFAWGFELTAVTNDPGGSNWVTSFGYYTDSAQKYSYGKLKQVIYPDGFWERREYGDETYGINQGLLVKVVKPWQDSQISTTDDNAHWVTEYAYCDSLLVPSFTTVEYHNRAAYPGQEEVASTHEERVEFREDSYPSEARLVGDLSQGAEQTVTCFFTDDSTNSLRGQISKVEGDGGWQRSFELEYGTFNPSTQQFSPVDTGSDFRRTVYHGLMSYESAQDEFYQPAAGDYLYLTPRKSIKEVYVLQKGGLVCRERWVFTGGTAFSMLDRWTYSRDALGHATNIVRYDPGSQASRVVYRADWRGSAAVDSNLKLWEEGESGIRTVYCYDALDRVKSKRKVGIVGTGSTHPDDCLTEIGYDVLGRVLTNKVSGGGLALQETFAYNRAGQMLTHVTPDGLSATCTYQNQNRVVTEWLPGGSSRVTTRYNDRRVASITGDAQVNEFLTYDLTTDHAVKALYPKNITHTQLAQTGSLRWKEQITDLSDRLAQERVPGVGGQDSVSTYNNNFVGSMPACITRTGFPTNDAGGLSTLYQDFEYNARGELGLAGQPVLEASNLSPLSMDRIQAFTNYFEYAGGSWYQVSEQRGYLQDNSPTTTTLLQTKLRITGLGANELAQSITIPAPGAIRYTNVYVDTTTKTVTTAVTESSSTLAATNLVINGLLRKESSTSALGFYEYFYDGLERRIMTLTPQQAVSGTLYNPATGQVSAQTNLFGIVTAYTYYLNGQTGAGQVYREARPDGKSTYYSYNSRGETTRIWGDVPYPEQRFYSQYGELTNLVTYRGGTGWNVTNWPSATVGTTTNNTYWFYDSATGLLTEKRDHANQSVYYDYYSNHTLKSVSWGGKLATYLYNPTGDLLGIRLGAQTNVLYGNFSRLGLPRQVTDDAGVHVLQYNNVGRLVSDQVTSGALAGITVSGDYNSKLQRTNVAVVRSGVNALQHSYGFDSYGRLGSLTNGSAIASYSYLSLSALPQVTTFLDSGVEVLRSIREWELGARLRSISHSYLVSTPQASVAYGHDALGRRGRATLGDGSAWSYDYNDRDEVVSGRRFWGDGAPVSGQQYGYAYDNIGNRSSAAWGGDTSGANQRFTGYIANGLNQYTTITNAGYAHVCGVAPGTNSVTVNAGATDRKVEYFHREVPVSNASGAVWTNMTVVTPMTQTTGGILVAPSSVSPQCDSNGNLTYDGVWTYEWDALCRLVKMTMGAVGQIPNAQRLELSFGYDHQGRRFSKIVKTWNGSIFTNPVTTRYLYALSDQTGYAGSWNLIAELDGNNQLVRSYAWGSDLSGTLEGAGGIGGLSMAKDHGSGLMYFPTVDGNGNVLGLVRNGDPNAAKYEYGPFGELIRATGPMASIHPFRWSTKFWDRESGLVYYGNRYYSPNLGRWISRDPIEENGGKNLQAFVRNSSTVDVDPFGTWGLLDVLITNTGDTSNQVIECERGITLKDRIRSVIHSLDNLQQFEAGVLEAKDYNIDDLVNSISAAKGALSQNLRGWKSGAKAAAIVDDLHHIFPQGKSLFNFFSNNRLNVNGALVYINGFMHRFGLHGGGMGGIYNEIWQNFASKRSDMKDNPYYVIGFGVGLFDRVSPFLL